MDQPEHRLHTENTYLSSPGSREQGLRAITAELLGQSSQQLVQHLEDRQAASRRYTTDNPAAALLQSLTGAADSIEASSLLRDSGLGSDGLQLESTARDIHHVNGTSDHTGASQLPFLVKNEIDQELSGTIQQHLGALSSTHDILHLGHQSAHHQQLPSHHYMMNPHHHHLQAHHLMHAHEIDPRHLHYGGGMAAGPPDALTTQKAVAFLAGPRERIHVLGNPVEHCPRCQQEGLGATGWRPHRHIGELKIRYICERHFDDLESNHHFDIPLCPICNQVLYLYDFNNMLGVSNARRLHKYVLKCANRHVLPLLDLFCQTKKGGERCNANFKLQWCYGTMVKRCEAQKNRDHDLWWVRYKNEWKQRRTIIRYKKDFLSHLTDAQRSLLLGLGLEGEPPPDPKSALGPTFDALVSSAGGSPSGPKIKKRTVERGVALGHLGSGLGLDSYDMHPAKRRFRSSDFGTDYSTRLGLHRSDVTSDGRLTKDAANELSSDSLRHLMGAVVVPARTPADEPAAMMYQGYNSVDAASLLGIHPQTIVTGTPTPPLSNNVNGTSPVAVSCEGHPIMPVQ